jgi:deoxyribodipyrimidine photo-lyase
LYKKILKHENKNIALHGGRKEGLKILKHITDFEEYEKIRDIPAYNTTLLSAHLKFGTLSPRETYHHMQSLGRKAHTGLIRQLYWRDFWYHIAYFYPHVFGNAFHEKYNNLTWKQDEKGFKAWCNGTTGFPIVDAGMRQLNETGFMHNRVRMIVASFLIKDLHIHWLRGEQYFAQKLVDYDPCVNNGNWQWVASTGCDPQPYFRIFNPWLQQRKYDPACTYIKRWIPELKDVSTNAIHAWYKDKNRIESSYPAPILDHDVERGKTLAMYKAVL